MGNVFSLDAVLTFLIRAVYQLIPLGTYRYVEPRHHDDRGACLNCFDLPESIQPSLLLHPDVLAIPPLGYCTMLPETLMVSKRPHIPLLSSTRA